MRPGSVFLAAYVAAAMILIALVVLLHAPLAAQEQRPAQQPPACSCSAPEQAPPAAPRPRFADHSQEFLDDSDEVAAMDAIGVALREVGDGASYVWHRNNGR